MLLIGVVGLVFAATLAWFSSPATMRLTRTAPTRVSVSITTRMFGLVLVGEKRVEGVQAVELVRSRTPGSRSQTPDRLMFTTAGGRIDRGYDQQLFAPDFVAIQEFIADPAQTTASWSSIARGSELRRFVFAQAAMLFLAFLGASMLWTAVRSIFPPPVA